MTDAFSAQRVFYSYPAAPSAATQRLIRDPEISQLRSQLETLRQRVETLEKARQKRTVALTELDNPAYRLKSSLWVELDDSGTGVTAHISELEQYGEGETEYEALADLRTALVETYEFLKDNESTLGPGPARQFQRFKALLEG